MDAFQVCHREIQTSRCLKLQGTEVKKIYKVKAADISPPLTVRLKVELVVH